MRLRLYEVQYYIEEIRHLLILGRTEIAKKSPLKTDKRTSNKRKSPSRILSLPPSHIDCTLLKVVSVGPF